MKEWFIRQKNHWKTYLFWILLAEGVGVLSALLTREGTLLFQNTATQPPLSPPAIVFPIIWTVLYALMGISAAGVSLAQESRDRNRALNVFVAQLIVNFFWSLIFFNAQAYGFALVWLLLLWVLIIWMILAFYMVEPWTAWLQIPYLIWVTFAAYLNWGIWKLN